MESPGIKKSGGGWERGWISEFGPYLTMGMQLAIAVVAFFFLGRWLDSVFDTSPWLMVTGLLMGTAGGFISFFRSVVAMGKREEKSRHTTDAESEDR
jgi:F0F1-type ATP synthase assembly protein I